MRAELKLVENPDRPLAMHPKKFALWLFMISIVMIFASLTSAYLVKRGDGNWRVFDLPAMFYYTSGVIIFSSVFMQLAVRAARKDQIKTVLGLLWATLILGLVFLGGQFLAWGDMIANNVYFTGGNPSESFIYVLSGLHWLHLVSGLIFITIILYNTYKFRIHSKAMTRIEMCNTYWHFLGGLWIYLFVFLIFNHQ